MKTTKQKKITKLELQESKVTYNYYAKVNMLNETLAYSLKDVAKSSLKNYKNCRIELLAL